MIPCRIFSGRVSSGTFSSRYLPGKRGLVYVLDELALKSQFREDDGYQHFDTLTEKKIQLPGKDGKYSLLDVAFQENQGYGVLEFVDKIVKPVFLLESPAINSVLPTDGDWLAVVANYHVWVTVADGARNLTTPAVGQLMPRTSRASIQNEVSGKIQVK